MENKMTPAKKTDRNSEIAKKIVKAVYPEYKGRKIRVVARNSYTMANYWDGGTRSYVKAVNLNSGGIFEAGEASECPFNIEASATFEIPTGIALVEHSFFCGKDAGITIILSKNAAPAALALLPVKA
jgi:hypothetical protein